MTRCYQNRSVDTMDRFGPLPDTSRPGPALPLRELRLR